MAREKKKLTHLEQAFFKACSLDVRVLKPGNVSFQSPGHGMQAIQFIESLEVITPILFNSQKSLGEKIELSVNASFQVAKCNTNLGIVLLCAPLIDALLAMKKFKPETEINIKKNFNRLQWSLKKILKNTSVDDTKAVFRAISKANPGGLGRSKYADVLSVPTIPLLDAMKFGAKKDFIAKQYCVFYEDIFNQEIIKDIRQNYKNHENFLLNITCRKNLEKFVQKIYFWWLLMHRDTHISRKFGVSMAKKIQNEACCFLFQENLKQVDSKTKTVNINVPSEQQLINWDYSLKMRKINPGTSADLTVCTLFLAYVFMPNLKYF